MIAGIAITAENRATLDFSDVYLRSPARFVVRRKDAGMDDLARRAARQDACGRHQHRARGLPRRDVSGGRAQAVSDGGRRAREALKAGAADAHFGDGLQLSFWLQSEAAADCCVFAGGPYLESRFFGQGYAIAVAKGSTDLKHALNAALQAIYEKGVYAELYLRYFPVGFF